MIRPVNYFETVEKLDMSSLNEALREGHEYVKKISKNGETWSFYDRSDSIRDTVDLYFGELEEFLKKNKKEATKPEAKKRVLVPRKSSSRVRKVPTKRRSTATKPKVEAKTATPVERVSEELRFIKRYLLMDGKEKTRNQFRLFLNALQRAMLERRIRKTSKFAKQILYIQDKLMERLELQKGMAPVLVQIDPKVVAEFSRIARLEKQMLSVRFIKSYVSLQGKEVTTEKVRSLHNRIAKAINSDKLPETDPYYDKVQMVLSSLKKFGDSCKAEQGTLTTSKTVLNGLEGVLKSCGVCMKSNQELNGLKEIISKRSAMQNEGFVPLDQIGEHTGDVFRLKGEMGELLGDLERYKLAMTIEGEQGAGKTRFVFQLANCFADIGKKVGVYSLEIGRNSDLVTRMRDEYVDPDNVGKIQITGQAKEGIETVRRLASNFDVIVIDSWNQLGADTQEFNKLRNDFPGKIWIVIFQSTTSGMIRGGTRPLYDAGINIEVVKSPDGFEHNYAHCTKNRYGITGKKYFLSPPAENYFSVAA